MKSSAKIGRFILISCSIAIFFVFFIKKNLFFVWI